MIKRIKSKIAEYLGKSKFSGKEASTKSFHKFVTNAKSVLIILPLDRAQISLDIIEVVRFFAVLKKEIYLIHKKEHINYLPTDFKFASLIVSENDKTKLGLPANDLIKKIGKHNFNIVLDLNIAANIFTQAISNIPKSDYRIGFIGKNSDYFYSYQVPAENNSEISYRNLLNSLRMF